MFFQGPGAPGQFPTSPSLTLTPLTLSQLNDVVAADLDGNGDTDLASVEPGSQPLSLPGKVTMFLQTAPGVFTPVANTLPVATGSYVLAAADLDGDGDADLAWANAFEDTMNVFFNGH